MGGSRDPRYSDVVIVFALILFVPVALLAAAILQLLLSSLRLLPAGASGPVSYFILTTFCLGSLFVWITLDDLVFRPATIQRELFGRQLGSPLQLRRYESHGFQDPHYEWHYAIDPDQLRQLRRTCRHLPLTSPAECLLRDHEDGSWWQGVGLRGDTLWVIGSDS